MFIEPAYPARSKPQRGDTSIVRLTDYAEDTDFTEKRGILSVPCYFVPKERGKRCRPLGLSILLKHGSYKPVVRLGL